MSLRKFVELQEEIQKWPRLCALNFSLSFYLEEHHISVSSTLKTTSQISWCIEKKDVKVEMHSCLVSGKWNLYSLSGSFESTKNLVMTFYQTLNSHHCFTSELGDQEDYPEDKLTKVVLMTKKIDSWPATKDLPLLQWEFRGFQLKIKKVKETKFLEVTFDCEPVSSCSYELKQDAATGKWSFQFSNFSSDVALVITDAVFKSFKENGVFLPLPSLEGSEEKKIQEKEEEEGDAKIKEEKEETEEMGKLAERIASWPELWPQMEWEARWAVGRSLKVFTFQRPQEISFYLSRPSSPVYALNIWYIKDTRKWKLNTELFGSSDVSEEEKRKLAQTFYETLLCHGCFTKFPKERIPLDALGMWVSLETQVAKWDFFPDVFLPDDAEEQKTVKLLGDRRMEIRVTFWNSPCLSLNYKEDRFSTLELFYNEQKKRWSFQSSNLSPEKSLELFAESQRYFEQRQKEKTNLKTQLLASSSSGTLVVKPVSQKSYWERLEQVLWDEVVSTFGDFCLCEDPECDECKPLRLSGLFILFTVCVCFSVQNKVI